MPTQALDIALTIALLVFALGRFVGWTHERLKFRDWTAWRDGIEREISALETDYGKRFDQANGQMSKIASQLQNLDDRFISRDLWHQRVIEVDRRLEQTVTNVEARELQRRLDLIERRVFNKNR